MKPTAKQREVLLALADQAALWTGRFYTTKEGFGFTVDTRTSASLVSNGWAKVAYRETAPEHSKAFLEVTPEGLGAVVGHL